MAKWNRVRRVTRKSAAEYAEKIPEGIGKRGVISNTGIDAIPAGIIIFRRCIAGGFHSGIPGARKYSR
jgi:hypothetical protein